MPGATCPDATPAPRMMKHMANQRCNLMFCLPCCRPCLFDCEIGKRQASVEGGAGNIYIHEHVSLQRSLDLRRHKNAVERLKIGEINFNEKVRGRIIL